MPLAPSQAMGKYAGGTAEYRSSEGKAVEVPYRGPVEGTLLSILGGLRSACTYVGECSVTIELRIHRQSYASLS